jgi:hypothetical protein
LALLVLVQASTNTKIKSLPSQNASQENQPRLQDSYSIRLVMTERKFLARIVLKAKNQQFGLSTYKLTTYSFDHISLSSSTSLLATNHDEHKSNPCIDTFVCMHNQSHGRQQRKFESMEDFGFLFFNLSDDIHHLTFFVFLLG